MKVIILSVSKYKEKDCIYNALSEEGLVSFQAKGAQDPKSKFIWLNNPLTIADVEFLEDGRYKHKLVKAAMPVLFALSSDYDYDYICAVNALVDLSNNVLLDEEKQLAFKDLLNAIKALKEGKDHHMVILIYLAKLLKYSGVELEVDKCVFCGSKEHMVAFSLENGGFVCTNCIRNDINRDLKVSQMRLIRFIFKSPDFSYIDKVEYDISDKKLILKKLKEFADVSVGACLKSLDELIK